MRCFELPRARAVVAVRPERYARGKCYVVVDRHKTLLVVCQNLGAAVDVINASFESELDWVNAPSLYEAAQKKLHGGFHMRRWRVEGASREEALVAALLSSAEARLAAFDAALAGPFYGPHLHRWGSAFPAGVLVPPDAAVVPSARVVFLGDYVDTGRAGTLEGAALSGLAAAEALVAAAAAA